MTVLIVDDHAIARRGLSAIVRDGLGARDIREAADGTSAMAIARECEPELVLLDLQFPGPLTARELCAQLRAITPLTRIVIVTAFNRTGEIRDCLIAGANGCLLKDTDEVDLAAALRAVLAGGSFIDPRMAEKLAFEAVGTDGPHLTGREREVLFLLAQGCSNRAIAERLVISEATVKGYVSSLLDKLEASSRLEAVALAAQAQLI